MEFGGDEHTHGLVQARAHRKPFFVGADENKNKDTRRKARDETKGETKCERERLQYGMRQPKNPS